MKIWPPFAEKLRVAGHTMPKVQIMSKKSKSGVLSRKITFTKIHPIQQLTFTITRPIQQLTFTKTRPIQDLTLTITSPIL